MRHGVTRFGVRVAALLALVAGSSGIALAQDGLRVVPLLRGDQVLVSFTLSDGFTDEVRAAIQSGLKTSFTYAVDLRLDVPGWVDRTIATSTATSSVEFDNLTRRYDLVRTVDGRIVDTSQTEDEAVVRQWMTSLRQLQSSPPGTRGQPRILRHRARDSAAEQRVDPLALRQQHLGSRQIHLHSLVSTRRLSG